jgi:hypothetical protein
VPGGAHFVHLTVLDRVKSTLCTYTVLFVDLTIGGNVKSTKCTLTAAGIPASLPSRS